MNKTAAIFFLSLTLASCRPAGAAPTEAFQAAGAPTSAASSPVPTPTTPTALAEITVFAPSPTAAASSADATATAEMAEILAGVPPSKLRPFELNLADFSPREKDYQYIGPIGGEIIYIPDAVDLIGFTFAREKDSTACMFNLIEMETPALAETTNSEIKSRYLEGVAREVSIPPGASLPENAWMVHYSDPAPASLILGFSTGEAISVIYYGMVKGAGVEEEINFVWSLARAQYQKLAAGGYR